MDIHKIAHEFTETLRGGHHLHLSLFAALISVFDKRLPQKMTNIISDLGDLGDNVPTTLIVSRLLSKD